MINNEDNNVVSNITLPAKRTASVMEEDSSDNNSNPFDGKRQRQHITNNSPTTDYYDTTTTTTPLHPSSNDISSTRISSSAVCQVRDTSTEEFNDSRNNVLPYSTVDNREENNWDFVERRSITQSTAFSIMSILKPCMSCHHSNYREKESLVIKDNSDEETSVENNNEHHSIAPVFLSPGNKKTSRESIIQEYLMSCNVYGCSNRVNAGVLTTIRFSLPNLRVSGDFHDADMLALSEILLRHCNNSLSFIKRLDFSIASKQGKLIGKTGFGSHGAFILSKLLQKSQYIEELYMQNHRVGPFGASAIFQALEKNNVLKRIAMRNCSIKERGAIAFVDCVCCSDVTAVREVDLSVNVIGIDVSCRIEQTILKRKKRNLHNIEVDLKGNVIFHEVMSCVTHGLGIILCLIGTYLLSNRVKNKSQNHVISCAIYSTSLLVLYTSSTLYHSFFALQTTKYIFEIFDHCAIYILIAGSYTPYLCIPLADKPIWSTYLLAFIWLLGILGVSVEAMFTKWKHKPKFSLTMYLGMGWCCMVCVPDLVSVLPQGAVNLLLLGGVAYTAGVPFFIRNNHLDHSIWHCFVLAGSVTHWFGVYSYVALHD